MNEELNPTSKSSSKSKSPPPTSTPTRNNTPNTSSIIQEFNIMNHRTTTSSTSTPSKQNDNTISSNLYHRFSRNHNHQSNLPRKRLFAKTNTSMSMSKSKKSLTFFILCFCAFILLIAIVSIPTFLAFSNDDGKNNEKAIKKKNNNGSALKDTSTTKNLDITTTTMHKAQENTAVVTIETHNDEETDKTTKSDTKTINNNNDNKNKLNLKSCSFRTYKENRYYKVDAKEKESFLSNAEYIRGQYPFVLNPRSQFTSDPTLIPKKLCLDTSSWEDVNDDYWPFSDGQNPSVISLASNVYDLPNNNNESRKDRIDHSTSYLQPLKDIYDNGQNSKHENGNLEDLYLGLLLFGDSQCRWNLSKDELETKKFSPLDTPPEKRSMVVIFDSDMNAINSSVLNLVLDANWGTKRKKLSMSKNSDGTFEKRIVELDDARIFFYNSQLHVLYRNGPMFGYDNQLQNPIHFKKTGEDTFEAYIKASESFKVCCGRNIAFISEIPTPSDSGVIDELRALTWIDPVTTEVVKPVVLGDGNSATSRRLSEGNSEHIHRLLKEKKKKSHIHGTNGYMLPFHTTSEVFGIAHFHRPEGRETSDYARHGHHYTHAFFTLQYSSTKGEYVLKRLSNEFIFMAPSSNDENTGDVIQFASGLDLVGSDIDGKLMISYGINDCEAATFFVRMERVQNLLIDVKEGEEVVNLMDKVKNGSRRN